MSEHVLSMVVSNHSGVLARITSIFNRKQLNIKSLSIVQENDYDTRRITILAEGDAKDADLAKRLLANNEDVEFIQLLSIDDVIERELVLLKAEAVVNTDFLLNKLNNNFLIRVLRRNKEEIVIEFIGSPMEVNLFLEEARELNATHVSRTGVTAMVDSQNKHK